MQPVDGVEHIIEENIRVTFELFLNMGLDSLLPIFISIVYEPLFAVTNNTGISWSRDHISIGFIVLNS